MGLFHELNAAGRTIIMVTHDEDVAGHAKRIVRVKDGRIVDDSAKS
jgi:putative ABC transport system ATP-binding protein